MNTDRSNKAGKHWWSTLDIDLKSDFLLFDSFRVEGLKNFIIQDNKKIVEKVIKGIEKIERKDNKLTQVRLRFLVKNFRELKDNKKLSLFENFARYESQTKQTCGCWKTPHKN